jgi:predicted kinase
MKTHLVIVSGASASGKTDLAEQLRDALGYPLLAKDDFKETLMDVWPPQSREDSERIGQAGWPILFTAASAVVGRVPGLILEANFQSPYAEPRILELIPEADPCLIYCHASREATIARIEARKDDPDRHPGHFDEDGLPILFERIEQGAYRLDLPGVPVFDVDSTSGYTPSIEEILKRVSRR